MNKRLSIKQVSEMFKLGGCTLLSTEYHNNQTPLKYTCSCGRESQVSVCNFRKGHLCIGCGRSRQRKAVMLTYDFVKDYFQKHGCILVSNIYKNNHTPLDYICKCGREAKISFNSFQLRHRCGACGLDKLKSIRGKLHHSWNPDRKYVALMRTVKRRSSLSLLRILSITGRKKLTKSEQLLGYSTKELKTHLEKHPNWNRVKNIKWNIDHIFPIKAFVENGITDVRLINCLENLQPLEARENFRKNATYNVQEFHTWLQSKGVQV